ncbi:MAG: hypothetical protein Q8R34_00940 [bacterium]|nr:hypothetical protein [bacterium]
MNLFFKDARPLDELIEEVSQCSLEFKFWAQATVKTGWLDRIVQILILNGKADDKKQAIEYLQKLSIQKKWSDPKIAKSDFTGKTSREPFRLLEQKLGVYRKTDENIYRHYGIVGHQAVSKLMSGNIPSYQNNIPTPEKQNLSSQIGIFETEANVSFQPLLFNSEELNPFGIFFQEILQGNKISPKLKT